MHEKLAQLRSWRHKVASTRIVPMTAEAQTGSKYGSPVRAFCTKTLSVGIASSKHTCATTRFAEPTSCKNLTSGSPGGFTRNTLIPHRGKLLDAVFFCLLDEPRRTESCPNTCLGILGSHPVATQYAREVPCLLHVSASLFNCTSMVRSKFFHAVKI